jgi:hypothetical protein
LRRSCDQCPRGPGRLDANLDPDDSAVNQYLTQFV